jgi:hypothetical protein
VSLHLSVYLENRRAEQVLLVPVGGGRHRKGCRRESMVEYYALMYENGKMRPVETILGMGGRNKGK